MVIHDTMLLVSLHLQQEVRTDGEDRLTTAANAGVVARPGFVARADDRRLLTGAASSARISFYRSPLGLHHRESISRARPPDLRTKE